MGSSMARYAILAGIDLLGDVMTTGQIARETIDPRGKNDAKKSVRTPADVVARFAQADSDFTIGPDTLEKILKKWGAPPNEKTCRQIFSAVSRLSDASGFGPLPQPIIEQMLGFDAEVAAIVAAADARDKELAASGVDEAASASAVQKFKSVAERSANVLSERAEHWGHWATGLRDSDAKLPVARFQELWLQLMRFMAYDEMQWIRAEIVGRDDEPRLIADEVFCEAIAAARRALAFAQRALRALAKGDDALRVFLVGNEMLLAALTIPSDETIGHKHLRRKWADLGIVEAVDAASWCGTTSRLLRGFIEYAGYADERVDALRMWERLKLRDTRFGLKGGVELQPAYWLPDLDSLSKDNLCANVAKIIADYEMWIVKRDESETIDQRVDAYAACTSLEIWTRRPRVDKCPVGESARTCIPATALRPLDAGHGAPT